MIVENLRKKPTPVYKANKRLLFVENEHWLMHILIRYKLIILPNSDLNYNVIMRVFFFCFGVKQQMWKNSSKSANPTFLDPTNPHWGWSWLERWMAARPWEAQSIPDKEPSVGEMAKRVSRPSSRQSPRATSSNSRVRPESQNGSVDDDSKSYYSVQSDRNRRLSTASSVRDDASVDSSPSVPGYMASTKSTKARSRMASPNPSPLGSGRKGTSEIGSAAGSAKKRLSFSGSPARTTKRMESNS